MFQNLPLDILTRKMKYRVEKKVVHGEYFIEHQYQVKHIYYYSDAIAAKHLIMSLTHSLSVTLSKFNKADLYNLHGLMTSAAHWPFDLSCSLAYFLNKTKMACNF